MESIVFLPLYLLPAILAFARGHKNAGAIFMLNLLLGWTIIGWIAAIIWAYTSNLKEST